MSFKRILAIGLLAAAAIASAQNIIDRNQGLAGGYFGGSATWTRVPGMGYRVRIPAREIIVIQLSPAQNWSGRSHVDIDITNITPGLNEFSFAVQSASSSAWISSVAVLGPSPNRISMPLINSADRGLTLLPTAQNLGNRVQTSSTGTISHGSVHSVFIFNDEHSPVEFYLESVSVASRTIPSTQIVDEFGQQRWITFPHKIESAEAFQKYLKVEPKGFYPYLADPFGGVLAGPTYTPTGRFRTVKDGSNWYIVTPAGKRFFSMGINEIGSMAWTRTQGREHLFTNLAALEAQFPSHFSIRDGQKGFKPYSVNLERKFGPNWFDLAGPVFMGRMRSWGFNTVGANSWEHLLKDTYSMPSTLMIEPDTVRLPGYDGMGVADPYAANFRSTYVEQIRNYLSIPRGNLGGHAYSLGIFVDNEPSLGRHQSTDPRYRYALALYSLNANPSQPSRQAFVSQLKAKYGNNIASLNASWGTSFSNWSTFDTGYFGWPWTVPAGMQTDFINFARDYSARYFSTVKSVLNEVGYQGLYLGSRLRADDYTPEVLEGMAPYVDVVSVNVYRPTLDSINSNLRTLDKPIILGELCFGAADEGRVGTFLGRTMTSADQARAIAKFMDNLRTWPNVVGVHWYRWEDFPITGKQNQQNENGSMGLVSVADTFYWTLVQEMTRQSAITMQRLQSQP